MPLPLPPSLPARPNVSIRGGSVQPPSPPAASATPSASQPPAPPGLPAPPAGRKVMAYDDLAGGVEEGEVKSDDEEWEREVRERREGMRMREERRREREEEDRRRRSDRWAPERDRGRSYRDTRLSPRRSPRPSYWRPSRSRSRSPRRRRSFSLSRSRSPRGHSRSPRGRSRSRTRSLSPRSRRSYGSRSRSRTVSRSLSRSPSSRRSSRSRSRGRDRSRSRSRERSRSPARSTPLPSIPTGPKQMIPSGPKRQYSHHPGGPSQGPPKRIMSSRPIGVPPPNAPTGPKEFQQGQTSQSQSQPQIQSPAGRSLAKGIVVKRTLSSSGGTGDKAEEGEVAAKGTNVETPIPTGPRSLIDKVSTPPGSGSSTRNPPTPLPPGAIPAGPRAMGLPPKIIPTVNSYRAPPKWLREREQARLETDRERDQASSPQPGSSSGVMPDEMRNPLAYTKSVTVTSTPPASLGLHLTGDEAADRELVKVAKEREVRERALLKPFKWIEWDQLFPPVTVSEEESTALTQIKHLRDAREGELRRKLDDSLRNLRGNMITMFNAGLEVKYAEERRANAEACLEKMGGSEALVI